MRNVRYKAAILRLLIRFHNEPFDPDTDGIRTSFGKTMSLKTLSGVFLSHFTKLL